MRFVSLLGFVSVQVFAATLTIEGPPDPATDPAVDFSVIVDPQGLSLWEPTIEFSGVTGGRIPVYRTQPTATDTRFDYRVDLNGALPGRYSIRAHVFVPNGQPVYVTKDFVWQYLPGDPVLKLNLKDGDTVGPIFWVNATCENCTGITGNVPTRGWVDLNGMTRGSDGRYTLSFVMGRRDGQFGGATTVSILGDNISAAAPADPELPKESQNCSSAGTLLAPILALLWLWRRRAVVALGVTIVGCSAQPPSEIVAPGEGAENVEPLWPARVGWRLNDWRITDARGSLFFLQHIESGGQTYLQDAQGIWLVGTEYTGALQKPLLIAPTKVKKGYSWRSKAPINRPPNLRESLTLSTSDVWQFTVVSAAETTTPWGRRRMWIIDWVGPPRGGVVSTTDGELPRLRGRYAFVEGVGPITALPTLGWPKQIFYGGVSQTGPTPETQFGDVFVQLSNDAQWEAPDAPPDETAVTTVKLDAPIFEKAEFSGGDFSLVLEPNRERLRIDGLGVSYSNTGGFNPEGNTGGVTGYYATATSVCFDVGGGRFDEVDARDCAHGTQVVMSPGGVLHTQLRQGFFGRAGQGIESGRSLRYTGIGVTPESAVVVSAIVGDSSGPSALGGHSGNVMQSDLEGAGCDGRYSGLLEWKGSGFKTLCRGVDIYGVTQSLAIRRLRAFDTSSLRAGFAEYLSTNGPIGIRVEPGLRTVTQVSHHGLLRKLVWEEPGVRFDVLARFEAPADVRLRGAVQLDAETWLVMGTRGASWVELFNADDDDQYSVSSRELSVPPGTLLIWKAKVPVASKAEPLPLETISAGRENSQVQICWPGGAGSLRIGGAGLALQTLTQLTSPHCAAIPAYETADGTNFLAGEAPGLGGFRLLRP